MDSLSLGNLKVADLKKELKSRGLSMTGTKNELLDRLQTAMMASEDKIMSEDSVIEDESALLADDDDDLEDDEKFDDMSVEDIVAADPETNVETIDQKTDPEPINVEDEPAVPMKRKKISLNRDPVSITTGSSSPTKATNGSPVKPASPIKSIDAPVSTGVAEKVVISAVTTIAADKAKLRQQKFGAVTKDEPPKISPVLSSMLDEKAKKRAERFGTSGAEKISGDARRISLTTEDVEKLTKRKERFGITADDSKKTPQTQSKNKTEEVDRKLKRAARFAMAGIVTPEIEEKKKARAERFGAAK